MEQYVSAAIIIYRSKDHAVNEKTIDGLTALRIVAISLQSPYIILVIIPLMDDIGMSVHSKDVVVYQAPFKELYFTHTKILDLARRKDHDSNEGQRLEVLVNVMNELFA